MKLTSTGEGEGTPMIDKHQACLSEKLRFRATPTGCPFLDDEEAYRFRAQRILRKLTEQENKTVR